jgi:S-DNA-T family DNA segregation ATPase FtsK/SpoIIIE
MVLDPRGTLSGAVGEDHLLAHVRGDPTAAVSELAQTLTARTSGGAQRAPDVWLVVDDLDLHPSTPWQPLLPLLARGADIGLHVVVARRSGGAARALYEPLLGALRELGSPGVLLAGSPEEGPLLGNARLRPAVPGRGQWVG